MRNWKNPPSKQEVENELRAFFSMLQAGKLDEAHAAISHQYDDWDSQLWSLWQDTYLLYLEELNQEVADDSIEGRGWLADLSWLADLGIEEVFHWDEPGEQINTSGECVFVNLTYKGEVLDVSGNFRVVKDGHGYTLMREIIHGA